jgi:hypothetical protein
VLDLVFCDGVVWAFWELGQVIWLRRGYLSRGSREEAFMKSICHLLQGVAECSLNHQGRDVGDSLAMSPPGDGPEVVATRAIQGSLGLIALSLGDCGGECGAGLMLLWPMWHASDDCYSCRAHRIPPVYPMGVWGVLMVKKLSRDCVHVFVELYGHVDKRFNVSNHQVGLMSEAGHPVLLESIFQLETQQ